MRWIGTKKGSEAREGEGLPPRSTKGRDRGDETHSVIGRINELTSPVEQCTGLKSNATVEAEICKRQHGMQLYKGALKIRSHQLLISKQAPWRHTFASTQRLVSTSLRDKRMPNAMKGATIESWPVPTTSIDKREDGDEQETRGGNPALLVWLMQMVGQSTTGTARQRSSVQVSLSREGSLERFAASTGNEGSRRMGWRTRSKFLGSAPRNFGALGGASKRDRWRCRDGEQVKYQRRSF